MGIGRKRRRGVGELGRVAEIVMVLAAAGEERGGRAPTAAERALAAEARGALAAVVAGEVELRPRELFPTEAVRALVEDLGLTRAREPAAVGYRPRKASIADRVVLTKRKHGASMAATGSPRNLSTPMISPAITKLPLLNGTVAGASSVKSPSLPPFGSTDVKMEIVVSGSNVTQNEGAGTIEQSNKSVHHTANSFNRSPLQSSSQADKSLDKKGPAIYPVTGSVVMGYQAPKRELSVKKQPIFSNHKAIAKNVQWILHQPANCYSWSVPSTEYMNTRLDCQICKVPITNMESLLVCDACERGMHIKCLQYCGNQGLTKTEWYCPTCLARSKGKPLPPKYGKVTRTIVVPKTSVTSGPQPSQVAEENPTEKNGNNNKNVPANGSVVNQNTNKVGSAVCKSGTLALDATVSKSPSISGAEPQKEDVKYDEISFVAKEGNDLPCGGIPTETASTGASTYGSGKLSEGSHMDTESSSASLVSNSTLESTALSGVKHADHSFVVSSIQNCESTRTPTDEYQADGVINGIGKTHKHETMADGAISDHGNAHQVTLNGHICSEPEIIGDRNGYVGSSTASIVDWVGAGLKSIDNKTYYNSCNIDGIIYNLHDHILIASEGSKSGP
ncbi:hypothetical protein BAE44_0009877, partial [Dichanthelium oligosanthes]